MCCEQSKVVQTKSGVKEGTQSKKAPVNRRQQSGQARQLHTTPAGSQSRKPASKKLAKSATRSSPAKSTTKSSKLSPTEPPKEETGCAKQITKDELENLAEIARGEAEKQKGVLADVAMAKVPLPQILAKWKWIEFNKGSIAENVAAAAAENHWLVQMDRIWPGDLHGSPISMFLSRTDTETTVEDWQKWIVNAAGFFSPGDTTTKKNTWKTNYCCKDQTCKGNNKVRCYRRKQYDEDPGLPSDRGKNWFGLKDQEQPCSLQFVSHEDFDGIPYKMMLFPAKGFVKDPNRETCDQICNPKFIDCHNDHRTCEAKNWAQWKINVGSRNENAEDFCEKRCARNPGDPRKCWEPDPEQFECSRWCHVPSTGIARKSCVGKDLTPEEVAELGAVAGLKRGCYEKGVRQFLKAYCPTNCGQDRTAGGGDAVYTTTCSATTNCYARPLDVNSLIAEVKREHCR